MRYINDSYQLNKEFKRLLNAYDNYYWMVAWAGSPFSVTNELLANAEKIKKIVVGLHFYQTHPDFIDKFNSHGQVKFIQSTSGTFHPKVYLFSNDEENWELIIGSLNFTNSAFNTNNEACIIISSSEADNIMYKQVINSINSVWSDAKVFTEEEKEEYRRYWQNQKIKVDSLSRYKEEINKRIPFYKIPVVKMSWREYIDRIYQFNGESINERIRVLDLAQEYFSQYPNFGIMPDLERKRIGGYVWANQPADFRLFGTMQNATSFTHLINNDPSKISKALDAIPPVGEVTKNDYFSFVKQFEKVLPGNKYISASRLLAMKRPDIFFCISSGNNIKLAEDFEILGIASMNLQRYWTEIIERIQESDWWQNPQPINDTEVSIMKYRSAFMDAMYYRES